MFTEIMKMKKEEIAKTIKAVEKKRKEKGEDNSDVDYYNNDERYYI